MWALICPLYLADFLSGFAGHIFRDLVLLLRGIEDEGKEGNRRSKLPDFIFEKSLLKIM